MKPSETSGRASALVMAAMLIACADGPVGLTAGDIATLSRDSTAYSSTFGGPNGLPMDATAEESVQQLTLEDGTVWRASSITVTAVPDESIADPPFYMMSFGTAVTGSLESVGVGTHTITGEWPELDFREVASVTYGRIREGFGPDAAFATRGRFVIESVDYFDDVRPCDDVRFEHGPLMAEACTVQTGVLSGSIQMTVPTRGGDVVQPPTSFTVPIRRETVSVRKGG